MHFNLKDCFHNSYLLERCNKSLNETYGIGEPVLKPVLPNYGGTDCNCRVCPSCVFEGPLEEPTDFKIQYFIVDRLIAPYLMIGGVNDRLETVIFSNPIPFNVRETDPDWN